MLMRDLFEKEAIDNLEWLYGSDARYRFVQFHYVHKQRPGQAFMNTLRQFDPESYERLTGSLWDPFNDDTKIPEALDRMTRK